VVSRASSVLGGGLLALLADLVAQVHRADRAGAGDRRELGLSLGAFAVRVCTLLALVRSRQITNPPADSAGDFVGMTR
jgi:hypothetical protein